MSEEVVTTGSDEVISAPQPLIDTDVPAKPASAADEQKTDKPAATDETAKTEAEQQAEQEKKQLSRRERKVQRERDLRVAAETRAQIAEERLAKAEAAKAPPTDGEPKRDDIDPATGEPYDYESYLRRVTRWEAKQVSEAERKAEREASQGKETQTKQATEQQAVAKAWEEREKAFIGTNKDYETTVGPYVEEDLGQLSDGARRLIVDSDVGPQVLHHLAANPEVHDRIAALSPLRQVVELGKLEDKFEKPAVEGKKISDAPAPIRPVSGGSSSSSGTISEKSSQADVRAWMAKSGSKWVRPNT